MNHHFGRVAGVGTRRIRAAEQQHAALLVEQHDACRRAHRDDALVAVGHLRALGDLEIRWQRRCSAEAQPAHRAALPQRQGVAHRVVVEPPGQQHPCLGVGQLGDQRRPQHRGVDHGQLRRQLVLGDLAGRPRRPLGGVGQRRQPAAPLAGAVRVGGHCACHHRAPGQRGVQRLPRQVVTDVQPVQPGRGLVGPRGDGEHEHHQQRRAEHHPRHQLATSTLAPVAATVSYTRAICRATTDQS